MKEKNIVRILEIIDKELTDIAPTIDSKNNPKSWEKLLKINLLISLLLTELK